MSRAKQFAVDDVLAKAVHRFSTHGYHDTSIRDLEQCMGIHRTSMYGAFGSKRGLFVSALRYHIERYGGALRAVVERESSPAAAIGGVFAGAIENGGFIIGTAVELAAHATRSSASWRSGAHRVPVRHADRGRSECRRDRRQRGSHRSRAGTGGLPRPWGACSLWRAGVGCGNAAGTRCCLRPADGEVSADVDAW